MKSRDNSPTKIKAFTDVLKFGKHKDESVEDIIDYDPGYILWLHESKVAIVTKEILDVAEEAEEADRLSLWDINDGYGLLSLWDYMGDDD